MSDPLYNFDKHTSNTTRVKRLETGDFRLRRGVYIRNGIFGRVPVHALDNVGNIDPTTLGVKKIGSTAPNGATTGFAYVSDGTSITWYWDNTNGSNRIVVRHADRSSQTIPKGSIAITGLSNSITYYFLPYWTPKNQTGIGWVKGTVGTPQIAFIQADLLDPVLGPNYLMMQNYQDREALTNGGMTAATTSGGAGGGGGGGGGAHGTGCVISGTRISTLGGEPYYEDIMPQKSWLHISTKDFALDCTPDHPLYHPEKGQVVAQSLDPGAWLITEKGEQKVLEVHNFVRLSTKRRVRMKESHLFWANGLLSHNKNAPVLP